MTASFSIADSLLKLSFRLTTCSARSVREASFWRERPQARKRFGVGFQEGSGGKLLPTAFLTRAKIVLAALP